MKGQGSGNRILVTGGTGFIGSHTVVQLLERGYEVRIIDNLSNSRAEVLQSINEISKREIGFLEADLCDKEKCRNFLISHPVDAVIHFAALKSVGESVSEPGRYYRNNLLGLLNLIDLCDELSISKFVFSSSCSVYGEPDTLPISESAAVKPAESPYANTKKIGEDILRDCSRSGKIEVIALRYFNPVGAHPSNLIGEYPLGPPLNLFPVVTQTAIGKRRSMKVFGTDYPTPDGSCIRDYIHVMDIADAHIEALSHFVKMKGEDHYELFNLGTGKGMSVLEVIHAFEKYTQVPLNYELSGRREGDVIQVYADTHKANTILGWKAKRGLEEMICSAWNWEKKLLEKSEILKPTNS